MEDRISQEDGWNSLDDLKRAQRLTYGQRLEMLEMINEFLIKAMPERSKRISRKLREMDF